MSLAKQLVQESTVAECAEHQFSLGSQPRIPSQTSKRPHFSQSPTSVAMASSNKTTSAASHHQSATRPQPSKLMRLARELRDHIYFYMVEPRRSLADLTAHPSDWFNPNILLTNRQIRSEALSIIYKQKITVLVTPLAESNWLTNSTKVLEGLRFKRCDMEIDLDGPEGEDIDMSEDASCVGYLKGAIMRRSVFYCLVKQLNRMPCLEEVHIWSPRRKISSDGDPRQPKENAGLDENSERNVDEEAGCHEYLAKDEALSLDKLRQHDDAGFLESTTCCFQQLADKISLTIEGNLSVEDSKRILSLMDDPDFLWKQTVWESGKKPWRVFAVDTTPRLCESGRTRVVSTVLALSIVWASSNGCKHKRVWDSESAASIRTFVGPSRTFKRGRGIDLPG